MTSPSLSRPAAAAYASKGRPKAPRLGKRLPPGRIPSPESLGGKEWTPFQLPNLVLDLDALGNPAVRDHDESDRRSAGRRRPTDGWLRQQKRLDGFLRHELIWAKKRWSELERKSAHPWKISDVDVLAVALESSILKELRAEHGDIGLIGHQLKRSHHREGQVKLRRPVHETAQVPLYNGIAPRLWKEPDTLLRWMLLRQSAVIPIAAEIPFLEWKLGDASSLLELRRLVFAAVQTKSGLAEVQRLMGGIATQAMDLVPRTNAGWLAILEFVNSLHIRLQQEGQPLGSALCRLGLLASGKLLYPSGALAFWTLDHNEGHSDKPLMSLKTEASSVLRTLRIKGTRVKKHTGDDMERETPHPVWDNLRTVEGQQALFCLLTGARDISAPPTSRPPPGLGWAAIVSYDAPTGVEDYVVLLARLGAFRTLVAEYHRLYAYAEEHKDSRPQDEQELLQMRLSAFAYAMIAAIDKAPRGIAATLVRPDGDAQASLGEDILNREQCVAFDRSRIGPGTWEALTPQPAKRNDESVAMLRRCGEDFERRLHDGPLKNLGDCFDVLQSALKGLKREADEKKAA